ncbi:MAG: hypothetical protein AAF805_11850 [Planctomycetota bacterium]
MNKETLPAFTEATPRRTAEVDPLVATGEPIGELSEAARESSTPFVGRWNLLVSTTNWDKGRIIHEWRAELERSGAAVTEYSDEAWARLVGGVTSQHIGRLRRVHERFGKTRDAHPTLYWSHFRAAMDWEDAELWLEGAVRDGWSVSQMRAARWEAVGGEPPTAPSEADVLESRIDEDDYQAFAEREASLDAPDTATEDAVTPEADESDPSAPWEDDSPAAETAPSEPRVRPFAEAPPLPDDVADAFESMKLAILAHKLSGWSDIARDDLLAALDSLKALATAPSGADEG